MTKHRIVIIGTGFGGISTALNLLRKGISDFIMLERRSFYGGTWLQNRYPGAAVDVPSPLYSIEGEPYAWSQLFAARDELESYTVNLIKKHKLDKHIRLNSEVKTAQWDEDNKNWLISLSDNSQLETKILVNATGPLSTPVVPDFEGKDSFKGVSFHCNDWPDGLDLTNKSVAIVGSGASAIQIIPAIVDKVKTLHVFQRTPHWVLSRPDMYFPKWFRKWLPKKWLYGLIKWTIYVHHELRVIAFKYSKTLLKLVAQKPALRHLKKQVKDEDLRQSLTPDFVIGCKRILMSNTYYPALQKDNVVFHDKTSGIKRINESGIETTKDEQLNVDIIAFATGYDAADSMISYKVIGRKDLSLDEQWKTFPRAYLGTSLPNFPNFFVVTGPNTGIGHTSAIFVIESQMRYIMQCIDIALSSENATIEPTEYAEDNYTRMVHDEMTKTVWHYGGCQSWYQNKSGKVIAMFPGFSFTYRQLCKSFKKHDHTINL
uniref:flavin-containing monooxygenase n=1 Tax=Ningiella ruwaisensis TaxID=2364274 RepID=UPI00109F2D95|nr:NAD(P)/FAD-dependent oxidoreductase [Ningiella ruwaisensis]